jgi:hypothetical protein
VNINHLTIAFPCAPSEDSDDNGSLRLSVETLANEQKRITFDAASARYHRAALTFDEAERAWEALSFILGKVQR